MGSSQSTPKASLPETKQITSRQAPVPSSPSSHTQTDRPPSTGQYSATLSPVTSSQNYHISRTRPLRDQTQSLSQSTSTAPSLPPTTFQSSILYPTLSVAGYSSLAGLFFGSVHGILRSNHPVLHSLASCVQWGIVGGSFWGARSGLLAFAPASSRHRIDLAEGEDGRTGRRWRVAASTVAAAVSGGVAGAIGRGVKNVGPGALVFGVVGAGGQMGVERWGGRFGAHDEEAGERQGLLERFTRSGWSPVKLLTDEEWKELMVAKLEKIDVEIAVLGDNLKAITGGMSEQQEEVGKKG